MEYIGYLENRINDIRVTKIRSKTVLENLLYYYALKEKVRLDAPTIVGLDLTSKCNLNCSHCFQNKRSFNDELETENWLNIIDQLHKMKVYQIYLMGGEPFIHDGIMLIIRAIKKNKMTLSINSNATLITEKIAQELSDIFDKRFDFIQVSLDGALEETNDFIRGEGQFRKIISKIELLKKYNIAIRINMVINNRNYKEMAEMYRLCNYLGVDRLSFNTLYPYKRESLINIPDDMECINEFNKMLDLAETLNHKVIIEQDPICIPYPLSYFKERFHNYKDIPKLNCRAGLYSCEIDPLGNVYPCSFMHQKEALAGNIKKEKFEEIWKNDSNWITIISKIENINSICRMCEFFCGCRGGCISAGIDNGTGLGGGDPRCKIIEQSLHI